MRRYLGMPTLLGLGLVVLANFAPPAIAAAAEAPAAAAPAPGMARVWFLRPAGSLNGNVWAAAPMIYANGAPIGDIPAGAEFYRDFRPGTYSFAVQPYGLPTGQVDTVQLAHETQTYLEIQWLGSWQEGDPEAGWGFAPNTFGILTMAPQLAQAYLPTLTYHPQ